jgi:hypothetical protein
MSLYKRIWIQRDADHAEFRETQMADVRAAIVASPHPAPQRRKNRLANSPRWDPLWPGCLRDAVTELGAAFLRDYVPVNSRMMFRSAELRDRVMVKAEELWSERLKRWCPESRQGRDAFIERIQNPDAQVCPLAGRPPGGLEAPTSRRDTKLTNCRRRAVNRRAPKP